MLRQHILAIQSKNLVGTGILQCVKMKGNTDVIWYNIRQPIPLEHNLGTPHRYESKKDGVLIVEKVETVLEKSSYMQ